MPEPPPPTRTGRYVRRSTADEPFWAFVPHPLPPEPPLALSPDLEALRDRASEALGRLDMISTLLPDAGLFIYFYVRKEALLSSQIEGTQSSFSDLLLYETDEAPGVPLADVEEVSRYVEAMTHGLVRIRDGFPLSLRLIREIHEILLASGRGADKAPGEFRRSQNWIGGPRPGRARFVPPPPEEVMAAMGALETFLHDIPVRTPVLIKAALAHVQFETIHPFLDGNGRVGRLLVTFLLCAEGVLSEPMLYLSLYLKRNRDRYYDLLQRVRTEGAWEEWIEFFLTGVIETAAQAVAAARSIRQLFDEDRAAIGTLGRSAGTAARVHALLQRRPIVSAAAVADALDVSSTTAGSALVNLESLGIVREATGKARNRLFTYAPYLDILDDGTEPL
ncbi:MAG: Fic family protein [Bacteroidota bacterium]